METHHHAAKHGHAKKWQVYLSEFIMLFLAVFAGFIAENIREHYVERGREKEYIVSMVEDMKRDTLLLKAVRDGNMQLVKRIDTLLTYVSGDINNDSTVKKIYQYSGYALSAILYQNSEETLSQLKNAGGLRLIKDTAALKRIAAYDNFNTLIKKQGDAYYSETMEVIHLLEEIVDFSISANPAKKGGLFFDKDPAKKRLLYNKCSMLKLIIVPYCSFLKYQLKQGTDDISLLKKHYEIE